MRRSQIHHALQRGKVMFIAYMLFALVTLATAKLVTMDRKFFEPSPVKRAQVESWARALEKKSPNR